MGGSKKKTKPQVKQDSKYKVPKVFDCPLCDSKACLIIKLNKKELRAYVRCRVCNQPNPPFETSFCRLHKPVDVYYKFYEDTREKDLRAQRHGAGVVLAARLGDEHLPAAVAEAADAAAAAIDDVADDESEDELGVVFRR